MLLIREIIEKELRRFDIEFFAKRYPAQLSGGQQQRVALARMLAAQWGITLESPEPLPDNLRGVGIRAFQVERAQEPGPNVFRAKVDRITESRYEIMALVQFLDRSSEADALVAADEAEMRFLHQHLFWRLNTSYERPEDLPKVGEELLIRLPSEHIHFVSK